jgi:hypothetical protein
MKRIDGVSQYLGCFDYIVSVAMRNPMALSARGYL